MPAKMLLIVLFVVLALIFALTDSNFFSWADFFDTSMIHHEQLFVGSLFGLLLVTVLPIRT